MYQRDRYVRSPDAERALERWERHPLTMNDNALFLDVAKRILRIDHPAAPQDLRATIESLNQSIRGVKDASFYTSKAEIDKGDNGWLPDSDRYSYQATLECIRNLEKEGDAYAKMLHNGSHYLGHVVAGSGMNRTRLDGDKRRVSVDWALIQKSSNRIHRQMHEDHVSGNNWYDSFCLPRLKSKEGPGYHVVITWVYKSATPETSFPFAGHGDSGAWITRIDGKVFGILTGGDERQGTTYFSRINDVFEDIKDITGAVEVRVAPVPVLWFLFCLF
ncbi:hypothetical protein N7517_010975 [Penicillium concentricum]|uniref:Uncharacterized protein n=1 Tax=Penicillium concentricum TaxID=293559 RepID=A0A9W9UVK4_9EURO|nr:uncharacterized protein N7517_010975 [Penicillium concentricum]KAJ5356366.1 hypothetical protein N7517_010975 [Penicillium concentricum]